MILFSPLLGLSVDLLAMYFTKAKAVGIVLFTLNCLTCLTALFAVILGHPWCLFLTYFMFYFTNNGAHGLRILCIQ